MRSRPYRDLTPLHEWPDLYDRAAATSRGMETEDAAMDRLLTLSREHGGIVMDRVTLLLSRTRFPVLY